LDDNEKKKLGKTEDEDKEEFVGVLIVSSHKFRGTFGKSLGRSRSKAADRSVRPTKAIHTCNLHMRFALAKNSIGVGRTRVGDCVA
jgi:hypothetical protein